MFPHVSRFEVCEWAVFDGNTVKELDQRSKNERSKGPEHFQELQSILGLTILDWILKSTQKSN